MNLRPTFGIFLIPTKERKGFHDLSNKGREVILFIQQIPVVIFLVLGLMGPCLVAQDTPIPPRVKFQALLKEYQGAASSGKVLTDQERLAFVGQAYIQRDKIASKFVDLALKHPGDPIALDALLQAIWQVNTTPWPVEIVGRNNSWLRAFSILVRDHLGSEKLGQACMRLSPGFRKEYETFLRTVMEKSPSKANRGQATIALGNFLANRKQRVEIIKTDPMQSTAFENLFGKEYLNGLLQREPIIADREVEAILKLAIRDYGHVKCEDGGTVGDLAKASLFALRSLGVGAKAPEIEGRDQDGLLTRLGDYRGKVVVLDFWSEY